MTAHRCCTEELLRRFFPRCCFWPGSGGHSHLWRAQDQVWMIVTCFVYHNKAKQSASSLRSQRILLDASRAYVQLKINFSHPLHEHVAPWSYSCVCCRQSIFRHKPRISPAPQPWCGVTRSYPPFFYALLLGTVLRFKCPLLRFCVLPHSRLASFSLGSSTLHLVHR